ncbi:hypothetical protein [uncultured Methanobrevibacter sp.]|uniref:hypothetical protein n=1 Tax=uncultured Methanobrevibacter sp. TaxID=253161 RepID=UPI002627D725|nr:hypothetical protein [uncultured Methanobrevibacter sp.]
MLGNEISNKIRITNVKTKEFIEIDQEKVQIRENLNGLMAFSYKAPLFEMMDLEDFFDNLDSSGKLTVDIGGTGEFGVNFRGLIDGKERNYSQNLDHKLILLENHKCPKPGEYIQVKRTSKFVPRGKISE